MNERDAMLRDILDGYQQATSPSAARLEAIHEGLRERIAADEGAGASWPRRLLRVAGWGALVVAVGLLVAPRGDEGAESRVPSEEAAPQVAASPDLEVARARVDSPRAAGARASSESTEPPKTTETTEPAPAHASAEATEPAGARASNETTEPAGARASNEATAPPAARPRRSPAPEPPQAPPSAPTALPRAADEPAPEEPTTPDPFAGHHSDDLSRELALVEAARLALNDGRTSAAQSWLRAHAREFPHGLLVAERELLTAETQCALGEREAARRTVAAFLRTHPRTALADRARRVCTDPANEMLTDSDGSVQ